LKPAAKTTKAKTAWRCPKCGREFPRKSAFHSCGQFTVEGYLEGKNPEAVHLFQTLVETAKSFGEFTLSPGKTSISFRRRVNFIMVSVSGKRIMGYLFLNRPAALPCFKKVVASSAHRHVHVFQISDQATLRGGFAPLIGEAMQSSGDEEHSSAKKISSPCIGEEINAIYRQARQQQQAAARF
jgi:hypothetical protein